MRETTHSLTIENQQSVSATGVESVAAFSEGQIALVLCGGGKLYVTGAGLKITGFSKANGVFSASGTVTGTRYGGKSLKSRLFR